MNPFRITMVHSLVKSYLLDKRMDLYLPTLVDMTYHPPSFIESLGTAITADCPTFDNIQDFCIRYASASINSALLLKSGLYDCVINWGGGLHHAHKEEASGFCFTNDIVMAILELLKLNERVMYIDIDIHHGDGVEEAFYFNDRVLTCSLHKYGDGFFPETGTLITTPARALNIPPQTGMDDPSYKYVFESVVERAVNRFRPNVIVFQAGADSLREDRLGVFNLSIGGHSDCIRFIKTLGIPLILLGGGGYTIRNVSRCWAYETSVICGGAVPEFIPETNPFHHMFSPDYQSNPVLARKYPNKNKKKYLDNIISFVSERIDRY
jgi:histone deacetylase 3